MSQDRRSWRDVAILLALVILVAVVLALYNHFAYGDWTCAFSKCVKVKS